MPASLDPELHAAAVDVSARAHCPYSEYQVGAAIRTTEGDTFVGCNVENASYPEGWCAETSAIAGMVSSLGPSARIAEIVTVTAGETPGTPCGGCRQRIREFSTHDTVLHATTLDGAVETMTIDELLPSSFGPERLL